MPHIRPQPPRPPPPSPFRPDPDERDDRATAALTAAIKELTEWLRANRAAVTRADLNAATEKILRAIGGPVTPGIEAAAGRTQAALDQLDAQIDDK